MKLRIWEEERWPFLRLTTINEDLWPALDLEGGTPNFPTIDLTEAEHGDFIRVMTEFEAWQDRLGDIQDEHDRARYWAVRGGPPKDPAS